MIAPVSKTKQAIAFFQAGDVKKALGIINGWRPSKVVSVGELAVFKRGYGCLVNPSFYSQVGFLPRAEVEKAKTLFVAKFIDKKEK